MAAIKTYNVEADLPSLDEARRRVLDELRRAKRERVRVLKIIHGYGSSGQGGTLCVGLRKSFVLRKKEGVIKDFIPGGEFSIFNQRTLALLEAVPELRGDPDVNAGNEGVTVLWLK
ncbi:MAG: Smr/MutS family protein [Verrucomicrobia bacterium]|nr:Smr/MutS family protein [Verrucomicrobiota bacterium]